MFQQLPGHHMVSVTVSPSGRVRAQPARQDAGAPCGDLAATRRGPSRLPASLYDAARLEQDNRGGPRGSAFTSTWFLW